MTEAERFKEHMVRRAADYATYVGQVVMIHHREQGMTWIGRLIGITQSRSTHVFQLESGMAVGGDVIEPSKDGSTVVTGLSIQRVYADAYGADGGA